MTIIKNKELLATYNFAEDKKVQQKELVEAVIMAKIQNGPIMFEDLLKQVNEVTKTSYSTLRNVLNVLKEKEKISLSKNKKNIVVSVVVTV
jgi:predicted transcriptional regulator